jgi:hypothetical protein
MEVKGHILFYLYVLVQMNAVVTADNGSCLDLSSLIQVQTTVWHSLANYELRTCRYGSLGNVIPTAQ